MCRCRAESSTTAGPSATPTSRRSKCCVAWRARAFSRSWWRRGGAAQKGKTEYTKHMIRIRYAGHISSRPAANEIILINSHDGASSYQMLAGVSRTKETCRRSDRRGHPALELKPEEERAFAVAALEFRYGDRGEGQPPAPITAAQLVEAPRPDDIGRPLVGVPARARERRARRTAVSDGSGKGNAYARGGEHRGGCPHNRAAKGSDCRGQVLPNTEIGNR